MASRASAEEWYAALGGSLSQGDIVRLVPYGLIDDPLTVCQPHNADPIGGARYYPVDKVPKDRSLQYVHAKFKLSLGIVVWPDCQIDKLKNQGRPQQDWFAAVAPVIPLSVLAPSLHDHVRRFDRAQWFPLPARPPEVPDESYVDLRHVWSLRYSLLSNRVIALSQEARQALALHQFWFNTEVRASGEVECPHCHKPLGASVLFQYKDGGET